MSFESPALLATLVVVPLAATGYWLLQRRPPKFAVRYTNLEVLAGVAGRRRAWRRHIPAALLLASVAALCVAFARPTMTVKAPNERASVVLVVDTSGSMRATDVKPTRLAAAKDAMRSFLERAPKSLRVGVVSFSDEAQVVVSPTVDRARLQQGIDVLGPGFGTALGDALARAVELARSAAGTGEGGTAGEQGGAAGEQLKDDKGRSLASILLLSDGAQTRGLLSPGQGAERAQAAGIQVFTIALGTDGGTILAGPPGAEQVIPVPPDRETLSAIAEYTGAESFDAQSASALQKVYSGLGSRVGREDQPREVTAAFVAAGALLLAGAAGLGLLGAPRLP
jgi:Ca-activated chloride channel family protein